MQSPKSGFWGYRYKGRSYAGQYAAAGSDKGSRSCVDGVIVDKNNKIRLLEGSYTLKREAQFGDFVSLIPVTQALKGVTLRGFKYPLEGHTTYWGESLCVSNELEAEEGYISIEEGLAFLIESRD